jgi:antitoxin component HigA of HigAB toxin-antitoxin module
MEKLYSASDLVEAHLLRTLLDEAGMSLEALAVLVGFRKCCSGIPNGRRM